MALPPTEDEATFTRLALVDFKAWTSVDARLRPLTLILGANSSGKSSLLEPLRLLKQTFASSGNEHLKLDGDFVQAGSFDELVRKEAPAQKFEFEVGIRDRTFEKTYAASFGAAMDAPVVERLVCVNLEREAFTHRLDLVREESGRYRSNQTDAESPEPRRALPPEKGWGLWQTRLGDLAPVPLVADEDEVAHAFRSAIVGSFERLRYLGPVRKEPSRGWRLSGRIQTIDPHGDNAIPFLMQSKERGTDLVSRVSHWARELGVADEVRISDEGARFRDLKVLRHGVWSSLADMGFGLSQVLPVMIQALTMNEPQTTLILEEPESHLHPAVQSKLADLFIDTVNRRDGQGQRLGNQLLVETHSEHLLRRVQRRIAEGKFSANDVAVYFCDQTELGRAVLRRLEVDPYGWIRNWPDDFFGDEMGDLVAMSDAAAAKSSDEES